MANQNNSIWAEQPQLVTELVRLREEVDLDWDEIAEELGCTSHQARNKYRRVKEAEKRGAAEAKVDSLSACDPECGADCNCPVGWCEVCQEARDREKPDEFEVSEHVSALDYEYDEVKGVYRFPVLGKLITVSEKDWNKVLLMYSGDGANLTQHEIAMQLGVSKKQLEAMIRAYGHFKARPPVSREALARGEDMEALAGEAIEVRERKFLAVLRQKGVQEMEREVRRLRQELHDRGEVKEDVKNFLAELVAEMPGFAKTVRKWVAPREDRRYALHAPVFDAHIGLASFKEQGWTNDYNSDVALDYIRAHGRLVAQRIMERPGRCGTAYLTHGGDTFHAPFGRTEHGRPLQRDRPDRMLFHAAFRAFVDQIETVRPLVERVVVQGVEGNHGHLLDVLLIDFLAIYYKDCPDVVVVSDSKKRAYFRIGSVVHVLDHGTTFHSVGSEAALSRADRIARIVSGRDYHGATRVVFYVGHMHHREWKSQAHMDILRVPTMCHENEYEDFLGFYNDPQADLYVLDEQGRIEGVERLYLLDGTGVESKLVA